MYEEFLTRQEAADFLKVTVGTIDKYRRTEWTKDLHYTKRGRMIRFYKSCLNDWLVNIDYPALHQAWLMKHHSSGTSKSRKLPA